MEMETESKNFKRKYNHCKIRVKTWEATFTAEHGRTPDKADIKEAEPKIREYYKLYYKLKSALLEEQILGSSQETPPIVPIKNVSVQEPMPESKPEIPEAPVESTSQLEAKHQRKSQQPKKWMANWSSGMMGMYSSKSFRRRQNKSKQQDVSSASLLSDVGEQQSFVSEISFQSCASPLPPTEDANVESGSVSFSVENEVSPKIKSLIGSSTAFSPLFSSMTKVKILETANASPAVPIVSKPKTARKLDVGWVERCTLAVEKTLEEGRVSVDSGFESKNESSMLQSVIEKTEESVLSSDDEIISDSGDEGCSQPISCFKRKAEDSSSEVNLMKKPRLENVVLQEQPPPVQQPVATKPVRKVDQLKKETLEKKIKDGTLNENYVKINMKKKVYVRGKKSFNYGKYKKSEWKKKNRDLNAGGEIGGVLKCFKCGDVGHFSRYCQSGKEDKLLPIDETMDDDLGLPSLEEAEEMARTVALTLPVKKNSTLKLPEPEELPQDLPDLEGVPQAPLRTTVPPLNTSDEDILTTLHQFGHSTFRPGQMEAIKRILAGKSTLLMLSTGGGKSLCYQLPAFLYHKASPSIALVVSPLVSLMDDQVAGSLSFLQIGCLHTNQTEKQRANVIAQLESGSLAALLLSPEAVVSCDNFGFGSVLKKLPPIAFACIDEVHCVSQWSYNFRPSYLMLAKVLRERLNVKTFLGLTATASRTTVSSIVNELGIDSEGVIQDTPLPSHLNLKISRVADKDAAVLKLIQKAGGGAVLVYCTRREECVRIATLIRTALRKVTAQPYHAGLVASKRKSVQRSFMQGKLQVVVATVAFGMGINKQDIRCVLHYNMPKDWESYVQEVGRAGRDGQPAHCYLLLDPKINDLQELKRHIHSNSVERHVLRRLLARIFAPCTCEVNNCQGHEVAFSTAEAVTALDLPEENISTLLCYLEFHKDNLIQMLSPAYMTCKIQNYHGALGIRRGARQCPPLAVALAQANDGKNEPYLSFDVIQLARKINWDSGTVKRHLKQTEWLRDKNGAWRRSGMNVAFSDLGLRVRSRGDLSSEQLDEALDYLVNRVEDAQSKALSLLHTVYSTFHYFATDLSNDDFSKSDEIKQAIRSYFMTEKMPENIPLLKIQETDFDENVIADDVKNLILTFRDNTFNGRAVARIFYGIQSPNYPASVWFRARQWRAHLDKPFNRLQQIATKEILRLK